MTTFLRFLLFWKKVPFPLISNENSRHEEAHEDGEGEEDLVFWKIFEFASIFQFFTITNSKSCQKKYQNRHAKCQNGRSIYQLIPIRNTSHCEEAHRNKRIRQTPIMMRLITKHWVKQHGESNNCCKQHKKETENWIYYFHCIVNCCFWHGVDHVIDPQIVLFFSNNKMKKVNSNAKKLKKLLAQKEFLFFSTFELKIVLFWKNQKQGIETKNPCSYCVQEPPKKKTKKTISKMKNTIVRTFFEILPSFLFSQRTWSNLSFSNFDAQGLWGGMCRWGFLRHLIETKKNKQTKIKTNSESVSFWVLSSFVFLECVPNRIMFLTVAFIFGLIFTTVDSTYPSIVRTRNKKTSRKFKIVKNRQFGTFLPNLCNFYFLKSFFVKNLQLL